MKINKKELELLKEVIKDNEDINIYEGKIPETELIIVFAQFSDEETALVLNIEESAEPIENNEPTKIIEQLESQTVIYTHKDAGDDRIKLHRYDKSEWEIIYDEIDEEPEYKGEEYFKAVVECMEEANKKYGYSIKKEHELKGKSFTTEKLYGSLEEMRDDKVINEEEYEMIKNNRQEE